ADQGATSSAAGARESAQQLIEHKWLQSFAADVIEKEKRTRADDGDVVDTMIHQIGADGVVLVHRERDFQFRADAIDARNQNRIAHAGKFRAEQSTEAPDLSEHSWSMRLPDERLDAALELVAKINIHPGGCVGLFVLCHVCRGSCQLPMGRQRLPLQNHFRSAKSVGCRSWAR